MTRHATGPGGGKVEVDSRPTYVAFKLVNFDIDDAHMKQEHVNFIDREILPFLRASGFRRARLTGLASRTGGFAYDMHLGQRRAEAVKSYLFRQLTDTFKALPIDAVSAGFTQAFGKADVDGADDRAVLVEVFSTHARPKPAPVPVPPPPPNLPWPDYVKKGSDGNDIPMCQVPHGNKLIRTSGDNILSFSAGQVVDCVLHDLLVRDCLPDPHVKGDLGDSRHLHDAGVAKLLSKTSHDVVTINFLQPCH